MRISFYQILVISFIIVLLFGDISKYKNKLIEFYNKIVIPKLEEISETLNTKKNLNFSG